MSTSPFFQAPCPSCGAPVELASSSSAFAVCGYCRSGLSLEGNALTRIGEVAQVLEDYSPLQVGSSGLWKGKGFTVVGRIQMSYPGGYWNEWRVLFDSGDGGWLADASGQFSMLVPSSSSPSLPAFESLTVGRPFSVLGKKLTVVDHREARCTGAQGELPFPLTDRWTARVADLRDHETLVTLDYSDPSPVAYVGEPVKLAALGMQLLRDEATIAQSAGRLKGKLEALKCPACGASIDAVAGTTARATCGSCGSVLDTTGKTAQLIERANRASALIQKTVLKAGDRGVLQGVTWLVMGVVCQATQSEGETFCWTEYLLYNVKLGMRWLSFSDEQGWMFSEVLERLPKETANGGFEHEGATFQRKEAYESRVEEVWGSFNWEMRRGDRASVVELGVSRATAKVPKGSVLVSETTAHEQTWSLALPLAARAVASAFGKNLPAASKVAPTQELVSDAVFRRLLGFGCMGHLMMVFIRPTGIGFAFGILAFLALMIGKLNEE
ncbi:DUF4178 domain-containing protein [Hydrogenophaga sp.]|uniref:DUF4178 domain-containing protein n=1 Tax=Hydrogenophaga sp. TaxID=1904254 RepID=UPI002719A138|nr:DUF4178 domain-containing protein [Hydrogenophaga sp.]MDO9438844.1 DUF4178 domain-containing protein [Hydrogenophaga sp.]